MTNDQVWPAGAPAVGDRAQRSRKVSTDDIERFTAISGDRNPIHTRDDDVVSMEGTAVCYTVPLQR